MALTLQIRVVTGMGLVHDQDLEVHEGIDEQQLERLSRTRRLSHVGSLHDFVCPQQAQRLLQQTSHQRQDLGSFETCWQGCRLAPGTRYGVLLGMRLQRPRQSRPAVAVA
jgi:hypothetical protein